MAFSGKRRYALRRENGPTKRLSWRPQPRAESARCPNWRRWSLRPISGAFFFAGTASCNDPSGQVSHGQEMVRRSQRDVAVSKQQPLPWEPFRFLLIGSAAREAVGPSMKDALAFVAKHGVVLQSARHEQIPSLAE